MSCTATSSRVEVDYFASFCFTQEVGRQGEERDVENMKIKVAKASAFLNFSCILWRSRKFIRTLAAGLWLWYALILCYLWEIRANLATSGRPWSLSPFWGLIQCEASWRGSSTHLDQPWLCSPAPSLPWCITPGRNNPRDAVTPRSAVFTPTLVTK